MLLCCPNQFKNFKAFKEKFYGFPTCLPSMNIKYSLLVDPADGERILPLIERIYGPNSSVSPRSDALSSFSSPGHSICNRTKSRIRCALSVLADCKDIPLLVWTWHGSCALFQAQLQLPVGSIAEENCSHGSLGK